jgi:UPF0755 protein
MRNRFRIVLQIAAVGAAALAAAAYWIAFASNTGEFEKPRSLFVPRESDFHAVRDSLRAAQIVQNSFTFALFARATGWGSQIKAGHYEIESGLSNWQLLEKLRRGLQTPVRVTIPPGSRPEVVARVVARNMAFEAEDFLAALRDPVTAGEAGLEPDELFCFLLPETYLFYWLASPEAVISKAKEEMERILTVLRADSELDSNRYTDSDVVSLAAIVEWETGVENEKARIAGVYLNRLRNGWPLQADPTVQYAILELEGQKRRLFNRDYDIDHPYNTYRYRGLPPGPITNPSRASLRAVLNAEKHDYYYFVATGDGNHAFSRTLSEHVRKARDYHRRMRERRTMQEDSGG